MDLAERHTDLVTPLRSRPSRREAILTDVLAQGDLSAASGYSAGSTVCALTASME